MIKKSTIIQRMRTFLIVWSPIKFKPIIRSFSIMDLFTCYLNICLLHPDAVMSYNKKTSNCFHKIFNSTFFVIPMYDDGFRHRNWNEIQSLIFKKNTNIRPILLYRETSPFQLLALFYYISRGKAYSLDLSKYRNSLNQSISCQFVSNLLEYLFSHFQFNNEFFKYFSISLIKKIFISPKKQQITLIIYPKQFSIIHKNTLLFGKNRTHNVKLDFCDHICGSKEKWIVYVLPGISISGGIIVVLEHCYRLIKRGYNVSLVSLNENYEDLDWFGEDYIKVDTPSSLDKVPDIAVATHWSTVDYVNSLNCSRKIYFVQSDETRFSDDPIEKEKIKETYFSNFEYITEAKWIQKWLLTSYNHTAHYVPNAINPSFFHKVSPIAPKGQKFRVLLEGAINIEYKGMIDAFNVIKDLDCEVWCVSNYGRPKDGMRCNRFFEGVPFYQMKDVYSSCDLLLKMSRVEGFYGPPLEMMACGGLVVTAQVTGYDEYIVDKENALVVEPRDVEGAKRAIQLLMKDSDLCNHLLTNATITVNKWNDWEKTIDILESFYYG